MMRRFIATAFFVVIAGMLVSLHAQVFFTAELDSTGENSGSPGEGTAWAILSKDMTTLTYQVTYNRLLGNFTVSHFHHSGSVTAIPFSGKTASGVWSGLTDNDVRDLLRGTVYVNIHSTVAPGGEIRGFLKPADGIGFTINMDGAQASTASPGRGTGWVVLDSLSTRLEWHATVAGLGEAITVAHFHNLPSGGVLRATPFSDSTSSGKWSAIPDSVARLFATGKVYMNVHTGTYPGGAIRGTANIGGGLLTGVEQLDNAVPAEFRLEQNYPNPFNPSTTIRFDLAKAGRISLAIYNLLGQEIATLIDEEKAPGTYAVDFNANGRASGVYFYRLRVNGSSLAMRKMLLLK